MEKAVFWLLAIATFSLPACSTAEKYARNNAATAQWLAANTGTPTVNVTGRWHSDDWGGAELVQKGNRVTGYVGEYPVSGSVKGHDIYLALTEDGWTFYTVIAAKVRKNSIDGYYTDSVPFAPEDESPFQLLRTDL